MDVERVFHMKGGAGDTSYSKNSSLQKKVSDTAMKTTLDTLQELYLAMTPGSLGIADLGCSSGPNTLSIARAMIEAVEASRRRAEIPAPEIRVYLNDLPANDFNSVLAALPEFYRDLSEIRSDNDDDDVSSNVFVAACAGSFYGRLFPAKCLHFIYSSNSLHWLSRVPPGIYNKQGKSINKDSIHISETSPPKVSLAYATQFQEDFSVFLRSRSKELVDGGRMVLIFLGRPGLDHFDRGNILLWKLLTQSFSILVSQGEVEKEKVDSYEVPYYAPCKEEIEAEVAKEGSFGIYRLEIIGMEIKGEYESGVSYSTILARTIRAVHEPMMRLHFGEGTNLDALFETYGRMLDEELATEGIRPINFVLVLKKKGGLITEP